MPTAKPSKPAPSVAKKRPVGRPRIYPLGQSPRELKAAAAEARRVLAVSPINEDGKEYESVPADCSPLDYMLGVIRGKYRGTDLRIRCASTVAQYIHTATKDGGKKEAKQQAAEKAATGRFAPGRAPLKVVK